jgi:hypothetical protein
VADIVKSAIRLHIPGMGHGCRLPYLRLLCPYSFFSYRCAAWRPCQRPSAVKHSPDWKGKGLRCTVLQTEEEASFGFAVLLRTRGEDKIQLVSIMKFGRLRICFPCV